MALFRCVFTSLFLPLLHYFFVLLVVFFLFKFFEWIWFINRIQNKNNKKKQIQNKKRAIYVHANYVIRTYRLEIMHEIFEQKKCYLNLITEIIKKTKSFIYLQIDNTHSCFFRLLFVENFCLNKNKCFYYSNQNNILHLDIECWINLKNQLIGSKWNLLTFQSNITSYERFLRVNAHIMQCIDTFIFSFYRLKRKIFNWRS